ncbi:RNA-dependent RNA polymerase [Orthonairovirus sinense]|uniref:RNA-dependent RNA polymerase n=1 Tax=Orthonairovirus sp. TaxID=2683623 RepID=A0A8K1J658_9VIRU|nr:RNA-dependent RNA polymerase [Orthonairovirus sp.]
MEHILILDGLHWEESGPGIFSTRVQLEVGVFFRVDRVLGDGNCFYRSISFLQGADQSNHLFYRLLIPDAAERFFNSEPEALLTGLSREDYIVKACTDGEWAGSLEASMLSKYLEITIIIWCTNESGLITYGMKFGSGKPSVSYNLLLSGNTHFDALTVRNTHTDLQMHMSTLDKLEMIQEAFVEDELEPSVDSTAKSESSQVFDRTPKVAINRIIERGENIPLRVGRLIEMFFSCRLGFVIKESKLIVSEYTNTTLGDVLSINKLGHMILNSEKCVKKEYSKLKLELDTTVLEFADVGTLLRLTFPGEGLNRYIPFILESVILDILYVCTTVLLSTFLYKSKVKQKRHFILNCYSSSLAEPKLIYRTIRKIKELQLYRQTANSLALICKDVYGHLMNRIISDIKKMDGISLLFLRNVDFNCLTLNNYLELLSELRQEDNKTRNFGSEEVSALLKLRLKLVKIEEVGPGCMSEWYKEWKPSKKMDDKQRAKQKVIRSFFEEREMLKFISKSGKASGNFLIGNVLSYAYNLYLCRDSLGFTSEDLQQLSIEIRNLTLLQENESNEPVAMICEKIEPFFLKAFKELPQDCQDESKVLFEDIRNSVSHAVSWKHALRLKGTMYEGFFSKQYNWTYLSEDLKPSLIMAIQVLYPHKFHSFLERTQLHPEFRDLTPDFIITQRLCLEPSMKVVREFEQSEPSKKTSEGVGATPSIKRCFPLPEVNIIETDSIGRIINNFLNQSSYTNSKKNRFNFETNDCEFSDEDSYSKYQLLFVEVGYQTDVEGKVYTDTAKWKEVLKLLAIIGIKASLLVCVDCSQTSVDDWWISEDKVRLLKNSISHLFSKLGANSPTDVTDIVVGSVSTQKIRSFLKSGSNTRTPVSLKDVKETWRSMKDFIIDRPTGVSLPLFAKKQMEEGLVTGTIITEEGSQKLLELIKANKELLTDEFENTKYSNQLNQFKITAQIMLIHWLCEDVKGCRCEKCAEQIIDEANRMICHENKLLHLAKACILSNHMNCCHRDEVSLKNESCFDQRTPRLEYVQHKPTVSVEDENILLTELDKLIRLTLPGKTEKEKKIKRSVDCLVKLMMIESDIKCIKSPSGQLITVDKVTQNNILGSKKEQKAGLYQSTSNRKDTIIKNLQSEKLSGYSAYTVKIISDSLTRTDKQQNAKCALPESTLVKILEDLNVPTKNEEIINKLKDTFKKRQNFLRNNDKLLIRSSFDIIHYIDKITPALHKPVEEACFSIDCILFKEVVNESMMRYWSTAYQDSPAYLACLTKFLLKFEWFQQVVIHAKICETFLRMCTEFNRAGIKLLRVRHTSLNMAVKLPSNKKKNMLCVLYSKDMELIKAPFYMNRRQAVLGSAYPYIVIVLYMQVLQQHRCVEIVMSNPDSYLDAIRNRTLELINIIKQELNATLSGQFEDANRLRTKLCEKTGNFLNKSTFEMFINTIAGLNIVYGFVMKGSFLANSQPQNKQLQMLRYGMLNGISRISCPNELGKKFSSSCRRIEDNLSRLYLQSTVYCCCRDPEGNIKGWKEGDLCPIISIPCFSVYGFYITSDRQLIFDIYNVHIYNKEMDDFEEGCIQVLEETSDRHMNWEQALKDAVSSNNKRAIRLLLGVPNIHVSEEIKEPSRNHDGLEEGSVKSKVSRRSSISNGSSYKCNMSLYNTLKKTIMLSDGFSVVPDVLRQGRPVITGDPQYLTYSPSKSSVLKDMVYIIRHNPNYTLGSYELIQAATELAKFKYPPESIEIARRNPKNWISISEVTETTSIVSVPKMAFSVAEALKVNLMSETKKVAKMLRNKLKKLGSLFTDNDSSRKECTILLETVDGLTQEQKEDVVNAIFTPSKLAIYNWKHILKKSLYETLLTHDGNIIYCWIKSLALMVKGKLSKQLKFMNPGAQCPAFHPLFGREELENLINVREVLTSDGSDIHSINSELLTLSWSKTISLNSNKLPSIDELFETIDEVAEALFEIRVEHSKLQVNKRNNRYTSFVREEVKIRSMEKTFLETHGKRLVELSNLIFFTAVSAPWCYHYKALESYLIKHPEILDFCVFQPDDTVLSGLTVSGMLLKLYQKVKVALTPRQKIVFKFLIDYVVTMFSSNTEPFSTALNKEDISLRNGSNDVEERLLSQTKRIFAKLGLSNKNYDFIWTVQMIANSNFNVCRKLTGRSEGEKLPRSIRSKVVYEMVKLVGETNMAMLQQLAFSRSLNYGHRFYSVLAPKAQLGGCRDLLVQETNTKLIHATTEMFSRTLLSTTEDDGLTNSHLKERILSTGLESLTIMRKQDGRPLQDSENLITFYKVFCISGDNTKWGPIHCCSFFSGMMQQLLKNHQDWVSFYKITFIKNLCRQIEIPAASLKKIINVLRYKLCNGMKLESMTEEELRRLLKDSKQEWSDLPHVQFIIENYLSKGLLAMNSYNHMGQGIHHATSSILTSIMAELFEELAVDYFKQLFPDLSICVNHAGSSDDYAKCVVVSGVVSKDQYKEYEANYWRCVCRFKNFISAVNRCCQMKDSAKTLTGDCFLEFYSEFMMGNRVTPAVIKFIFTGLINSSVTSPSSLAQACHVSSQQAMYNSVPMLTNITFTLLRQQIFFNHVEAFIRKYGPMTLGSVSQFGRLYCPRFSNLVGSSITLEDCELISKACKHVRKQDILFNTSSFMTDLVRTNSFDTETDTTSSISSMKSSNLLTFDRGGKLTEEELRFMEACHEEKKFTDTMAITRQVEVWYSNSCDSVKRHEDKVLDSMLVNSCPWLQVAKKKCFLEVVKNIQMLLRIICIGHYRAFSSSGTEKLLKASLCRDENQIIEDPMIQLLPEKLRRELDRLGLSKMTVDELLPSDFKCSTILQVVAQKLISLNVATESYSAEVSRLKQTLTARNVLYGLAGGIKELSIPIYTIFLKSYFFKDNLFFDLEDRWPTQKSANYRDSTGRKLDGQVVTKYQHWLDVFLNCTISIDRQSTLDDETLFNESLKCVGVTRKENGVNDLSVVLSHLSICEKELDKLVLQFSDVNRKKIKIVESSPPDYEMEANKVVITKSSLFSSVDGVRLKNNPAVVIGYLLDESSISEIKPTRVDFSNLMKDKFKISQYFPGVDSVLKQLKYDSDSHFSMSSQPDLSLALKYTNYLTLISRMLLQAQSKLTVFYMIKGNTLQNEPTVSDLVSFGIKEGRYLSLPEVSVDTSTFSVKYWKILQCISAIGNLPVPDSTKREILLGFMNWKVPEESDAFECPLHMHERSSIADFAGEVVINSLASEVRMIKDDKEREAVLSLINFITCPNELRKKRPTLGITSKFRCWGDGKKNGRFTLACSLGEAVGIFVGSKLHIHLTNSNPSLLVEVERQVLGWLFHRRTEVLTLDQHEIFLDLLPTYSESGGKGSDGKSYTVSVDISNPKYLKLTEVTRLKKNHIIKVKPQILTVRKTRDKDVVTDAKLKWNKKSLSIVFEELDTNTLYHESFLKVRELMKGLTNKEGIPAAVFSDTEVEVGKIRFHDTVLFNSISLLHYFLVHSEVQVLCLPHLKGKVLAKYLNSGTLISKPLIGKYRLNLKQTLSYSVETTKDLEDNFLSKLSSFLTEKSAPVYWWPEVQQQIEEFGFSNFLLNFTESSLKGGVKWEIKSGIVQTDGRIPDIRRLVHTIKSGAIPLCFSTYIAKMLDLKNLIFYSKHAHESLLNSTLSNEQLNRVVAMTLFCFQDEVEEAVKNETSEITIRYEPSSLLNLMSKRNFLIGEKIAITPECHDGLINLKVDLLCLSGLEMQLPASEKSRLVKKNVELALKLLLHSKNPDLKYVKDNFSDLEFYTDTTKRVSFLKFVIKFWSSSLVDYTAITGIRGCEADVVNVCNLVLFLMGLRPNQPYKEENKQDESCNTDGDFLEYLLADDSSEEAQPGVNEKPVKLSSPPSSSTFFAFFEDDSY